MKRRTFLQSIFALPAVVAVPALLKRQAAAEVLFDGVSVMKVEPFSLTSSMTIWGKLVRTPTEVVWRDMLTGEDAAAPARRVLNPLEIRVYAKAHDAETRRAIIEDMMRHST